MSNTYGCYLILKVILLHVTWLIHTSGILNIAHSFILNIDVRSLIPTGGVLSRGQAAIEYLIILAVVVIIALIVIGVIGGFPGMTRGISERDSAAYWAGADVGITRYFMSATTVYSQLVVRNNRLFTINFTGISLDSGTNLLNYTTGVIISPGSSVVVNLTAAGCSPAGQAYSKNINISYKDATYGVTYKFTGEKPLVGTCQT